MGRTLICNYFDDQFLCFEPQSEVFIVPASQMYIFPDFLYDGKFNIFEFWTDFQIKQITSVHSCIHTHNFNGPTNEPTDRQSELQYRAAI